MLAKRFAIMVVVLIVGLLGVTACVTPASPDAGAVGSASATATPSEAAASQEVASSGGVTATTSSDGEADDASPGESEAGAGGAEQQAGGEAADAVTPAAPVPYAESAYKFSIDYPGNFVVRTLPAETLAQFTPKPEAAFRFMNPVIAASDLGDLEPADLEIRVFAAGETESLASWLVANELLSAEGAASPETFQTANVNGIRVCAATMVAPGCANFVMGNGFIYQLTAASLDGESMSESFVFMP